MVAILFVKLKIEDFFCNTCNNFVNSDVENIQESYRLFLLSLYLYVI